MAKKILIVDDDLNNMVLFSDLLQVVGYEIIEATNGKQGIELAKARQPDLILLDIQMPVMDGYQAIKFLKRDTLTKNIPVIALTSYAMKGDREKLLGIGYDAYIPKPVIIDELLREVKELLQDK